MAKNSVYIGVVVLAVIAVVLGYKIYQQQTGTATIPANQQPQSRTITQPVGTQETGQQTTVQKTELTAEEKQVLNFPGPNATDAEIRQHGELVDKLSIRASELDVTNCKPNPLVYEIDEGATFKVRNNGAITVELARGDKLITIPARTEKNVKIIDLANERAGNIAYTCMGQQGPTGVIQVVPKTP